MPKMRLFLQKKKKLHSKPPASGYSATQTPAFDVHLTLAHPPTRKYPGSAPVLFVAINDQFTNHQLKPETVGNPGLWPK